MGAHDEQRGIVFGGLLGELVGGVALAQHILQFDALQQRTHGGVAALYLLADGALGLVLLFDVDEPDVALPAVCDVYGQVDGIGRARRKIKSNDNSVHVILVYDSECKNTKFFRHGKKNLSPGHFSPLAPQG